MSLRENVTFSRVRTFIWVISSGHEWKKLVEIRDYNITHKKSNSGNYCTKGKMSTHHNWWMTFLSNIAQVSHKKTLLLSIISHHTGCLIGILLTAY